MKYNIPQVIKNLNPTVRQHVEKCYLAGHLTKKEFMQKYGTCRDIDCELVMKKVSNRVSSQHPQPDGGLSWDLARRVMEGVLKVMIYHLDEGIAKADRILKRAGPPEIQKLYEPWNLPKVSEEPPHIDEVVFDLAKLPHIAAKDIHQLDEFDFNPLFEEEDQLGFGMLTSPEVTYYTSDDFIRDLHAQEELNLPKKCPQPEHVGTPKRKAQPSGNDDSPPPGTPSKRARRNLEDHYAEDMHIPEANDGFAVPFPVHEDTEPLAQPLAQSNPDEVAPIDHQPSPEVARPPAQSPQAPVGRVVPGVASPAPRRPRGPRVRRRKPIQISQATLDRRVADIHTGTISIEERQIDLRKVQNEAGLLFRDPAPTWLDHGRVPRARELIEISSNTLRVTAHTEPEFELSLYRARTMINATMEASSGVEPQQDIPQDGPEESHGEQHVPVDVPLHNTPEPVQAPTSPGAADNNVPIPQNTLEAEVEFRESQARSSQSKTSRSITTLDGSNEAYTPVIGLTRTEFFNALKAKWQEKKIRYNLDESPPVDFDEVINPRETSKEDYVLALSYAMDAMMRGTLLMKQSTPGARIWLYEM